MKTQLINENNIKQNEIKNKMLNGSEFQLRSDDPQMYKDMIEKIRIKDFPVGKPDSFVGVDTEMNDVLIGAKDMLAMEYPVDIRGTSAGAYTPFRSLGSYDGTSAHVCLIAPISDFSTTIEDFKGVIGRLYMFRGGTGHYLFAMISDIILCKAYKHVVANINTIGGKYNEPSGLNITLGYCTCNGKMYLAYKQAFDMSYSLYFQGIYSKDCEFKLKDISEVSNWVDL